MDDIFRHILEVASTGEITLCCGFAKRYSEDAAIHSIVLLGDFRNHLDGSVSSSYNSSVIKVYIFIRPRLP